MPAGQPAAEVLTVKVTAKKRHRVGALRIRTVNEARLPGEIRAMAVITPRSSTKRVATFKVYVLINNLSGLRKLAGSTDQDQIIELVPEFGNTRVVIRFGVASEQTATCEELVKLGEDVDSDAGQLSDAQLAQGFYGRFTLVRLRPPSVQPSDTEAVLDNVIYSDCRNLGAEQPEPGPR